MRDATADTRRPGPEKPTTLLRKDLWVALAANARGVWSARWVGMPASPATPTASLCRIGRRPARDRLSLLLARFGSDDDCADVRAARALL